MLKSIILVFATLSLTRILSATETYITDFGAIADGETINTEAIQSAIDQLASDEGGTVVVPEGTFLSGALFFKPGVNLRLEEGAVIQASTDMTHFPEQRTRIEGHFEESFNPALINADGCDGLRISGTGTLDGAGRPIWDEFWKRRRAAPDRNNFKNLSVPRARLALIENSRDVQISGITFKDSQFWNLHIYNCDGMVVDGVSFKVPDDYRQAPSSDGIDLDSSRNVTITNCYFSVSDDAIALKGTKGPLALEDKSSPPVENIHVSNCVFKRAHGAVTCGSEATIVRNVSVENCRVIGHMPMLRLKLRPDTPQRYENLSLKNVEFDSDQATLFSIAAWSQYFDLKGQPQPQSYVRNISISGITGSLGSLGRIQGHDTVSISDILLKNIDVTAKTENFDVGDTVTHLRFERVQVNGKLLEL